MLGDKLNSKMQLYGTPGDPETSKCLMTAAEKGVDIEAHYVDSSGDSSNTQEFRVVSPLGTIPALRDVDFTLYGTIAIMSYLDDKGFGPSLVPRNGVIRAQHYQWIHTANAYVGPHIAALMEGGDAATHAKHAIEVAFDALERQLSLPKRGGFIVGDFTLADIHWGAYAHACELASQSDIIDSRSNVKAWWSRVKTHPSTSKERIVAYDVLPTLEDIKNRRLRNVAINT